MRLYRWAKDRISHKLSHLKLENIKRTLRENGLALVVIIVGWEIIEDVLFPALFALLGKYVHPAFFAGIPAAWLICLHWLAVPILWGLWVKIKGTDEKIEHSCDHH
tara:strand:+ start:4564 stop:4881 length:318 start_codon:yes stop_codon:yes gene_type:complete